MPASAQRCRHQVRAALKHLLAVLRLSAEIPTRPDTTPEAIREDLRNQALAAAYRGVARPATVSQSLRPTYDPLQRDGSASACDPIRCPSLSTAAAASDISTCGSPFDRPASTSIGSGFECHCVVAGHESPATIHMYMQADLTMKEQALNTLQPPRTKAMRYQPPDRLLQFLEGL
jgi:hypothetical protein